MKLVYAISVIISGVIMSLFSEKLIHLFNEDKYIEHQQNKLSKIIGGIGLILIGFWMLFDYLFN